jgi:plasmid stabilization system protein ParE
MILLSPDAVMDIERLRTFLDQNNPGAARRALALIWTAVDRLQDFPTLGMPTEHIDIRQLVIRRAELRLSADPAQIQHKVTRDAERDDRAAILLDQGQRQIDAGGDAGGSVDVPVADEDGVRHHLRLREQRCELRRRRPVRGGAASVEQAASAQQEGAGADAGDPPCPRRALGNLQPGAGADGAATRTGHDQFIAERRRTGLRQMLRGLGEHFQRPRYVEDLKAVKTHQRDLAGCAARRGCRSLD